MSLFANDPRAWPVRPAPQDEQTVVVARALPSALRFGTSSWTFGGWTGLVYDRGAKKADLAQHGLQAYARHPLLRAVGVDRTLYAPVSPRTFETYASVVPDDFRFVVKAHEGCTVQRFPEHARYGTRRGEKNSTFFDPGYAEEMVVGPFVEGLGAKAAALLFQFPPEPADSYGGPRAFADKLHGFLSRLSKKKLYAIELRNRALLTDAYRDALADVGAVHCINVHPTMPPPEVQHARTFTPKTRALILRWMLRPGLTYEKARDRYMPFDRLVDSDEQTRATIARLATDSVRTRRPAIVIANNKAEGSSPLSIKKLAEHIAQLDRA